MIRASIAAKAGLIPAVGYLRMSSKKQDKSIGEQQKEVTKYAASHGYAIIRWYQDDGISGSEAEKRDGFQRLMNDASAKGDFRAILCWDQDRFSRFDPLEANHYWFILRQAGVKIVTVRQGELDWNELGGWLVASINQHGKAQYLKDLSANVLRGKLDSAENGNWSGSRPHYGLAVERIGTGRRTRNGKLILGDPDQIATIKWIFDSYANRDMSLRDIAKALNDKGIPSPAGKLWNGTTVQAIIRREAYTGRAFQFKESKGKFHTIQGGCVATADGTTTRKARGH
jgi:DNA invertase Pin-like site-specific DNA recombinase